MVVIGRWTGVGTTRSTTGEASRRAAGGIRRGGPARGVCVQLRPAAEAAADERLRAGARVQQGCGNRGRMREDGGHWTAGAGQQWQRAWVMRPRGHCRIALSGPASASDCAQYSACRRGAGGLPLAAYAVWGWQPGTSTSAKAGLSDREMRNALDVCGLGGADLGGSLLRAYSVDADSGQLHREAVRLGTGLHHMHRQREWQCAAAQYGASGGDPGAYPLV